MNPITLPSIAVLAAMLVLSLGAAPAAAQTTVPRTWVASNGDGTTCSRAAPCGDLQLALNRTASGGEVNCVDAGDYGAITIFRSVSIACENTAVSIVGAGVAITVNITSDPSGVVTLRGLDLDGATTGARAIQFIAGAVLHVHKVRIRGVRGNGLLFQPSAYAELYVTDSDFIDNGLGEGNAAILIQPTATGAANVSINRVRMENNSTGISVDGTQTTGVAVNATLLNSVVAGSAGNGIQGLTSAGHAAVSILVDHSVVSGNFGSAVIASGVAASGPGSAMVRLSDSTIVLNNIGVSTGGAGVVQSFKNNRISGNLFDGTPIPAFVGPGGSAMQ